MVEFLLPVLFIFVVGGIVLTVLFQLIDAIRGYNKKDESSFHWRTSDDDDDEHSPLSILPNGSREYVDLSVIPNIDFPSDEM